MAQVQRDTIQEWNSGSTTIGPIPHSMNERVLKGLAQFFTHRDNRHGHGNSNIAFQRDLDELLEADNEYRGNPSFGSGPDQLLGEAGDAESTHNWLPSSSLHLTKESIPDLIGAGTESKTQ